MNRKLFIEILREEFFKRLETKTGWGKNQVKEIFNEATAQAAYRMLEEDTNGAH